MGAMDITTTVPESCDMYVYVCLCAFCVFGFVGSRFPKRYRCGIQDGADLNTPPRRLGRCMKYSYGTPPFPTTHSLITPWARPRDKGFILIAISYYAREI